MSTQCPTSNLEDQGISLSLEIFYLFICNKKVGLYKVNDFSLGELEDRSGKSNASPVRVLIKGELSYSLLLSVNNK
jgi:hypothetical protein